MRRRRRIAALFALVALVLSITETARAAVCEELAQPMSSDMQHNMPDRGHNESMPQCPLGAALQVGCAPSASLPAENTTEFSTPATAQRLAVFDVVMPHALRTAAIFHPPRF